MSFKEALNGAVRAGLRSEHPRARRYRMPGRPLGLRPGVDLTKALRAAAGGRRIRPSRPQPSAGH